MINSGLSQRPPVRRNVDRTHGAGAAPGNLVVAGAQERKFREPDLFVQRRAAGVGVHQFAVQNDLAADVFHVILVVTNVQINVAGAVDRNVRDRTVLLRVRQHKIRLRVFGRHRAVFAAQIRLAREREHRPTDVVHHFLNIELRNKDGVTETLRLIGIRQVTIDSARTQPLP